MITFQTDNLHWYFLNLDIKLHLNNYKIISFDSYYNFQLTNRFSRILLIFICCRLPQRCVTYQDNTPRSSETSWPSILTSSSSRRRLSTWRSTRGTSPTPSQRRRTCPRLIPWWPTSSYSSSGRRSTAMYRYMLTSCLIRHVSLLFFFFISSF